jgi:hypothetical protein
MKLFRIGVWEEQGGYMLIKAKTLSQAKKKAENYLNENGIDKYGFKKEYETDVNHRNVELI